jgi:hypothetical protein
MPIKSVVANPVPGRMIQICACCGAEHTISFDRGAQKTKTGPFALEVGHALEVSVNGAAPIVVTFDAGDFPDITRVTSAQLATKMNAALAGAQAIDDFGGVLIESKETGDASRIEIVDGTARAALGFATDGRRDPCVSRPVLGISCGSDQRDSNIMALRRCNNCGASEGLVRTHDAAPEELHGTHFAEHRKAVNALAEHCKAQGWSHADVAEQHATETSRPVDIHPEFLHGSVPLPRFARVSSRSAVSSDTGDRR